MDSFDFIFSMWKLILSQYSHSEITKALIILDPVFHPVFILIYCLETTVDACAELFVQHRGNHNTIKLFYRDIYFGIQCLSEQQLKIRTENVSNI